MLNARCDIVFTVDTNRIDDFAKKQHTEMKKKSFSSIATRYTYISQFNHLPKSILLFNDKIPNTPYTI